MKKTNRLASFLIHPCAPYQHKIVANLHHLPKVPRLFPPDLPPIIGGRYFYQDRVICILPIVALAPIQFVTAKNRELAITKVREAVEFSKKEGAYIVGLGAWTSPATDGGRKIIDMNVWITSGNPYTVYAAFEGLKKLATELGQPLKQLKVAIVGATGSVGFGLTEMLLVRGKLPPSSILGIGSGIHPDKITELTTFGINAGGPEKFSLLSQYDIVVICTSGFLRLRIDHFDRVTAIYDLTMPRFTATIAQELLDRGIILKNGGFIRLPPEFRYEGVDIGVPKEDITYACTADTILRALDGINGHAVGRVSTTEAEIMGRIGQKYNFTVVS
jgi:predicted amino acid dehydrogenase